MGESLAEILDNKTEEEIREYVLSFFKVEELDVNLCMCGHESDYKGRRCWGCPDA
jgi:hypothetical protein